MSAKRFTIGLVVLFVVLAVAGALYQQSLSSGGTGAYSRSELSKLDFFLFDRPRTVSETPLLTLDGNETSLAAVSEQWQLVNFGYMFCPDICPINLRLMSDLKNEWDASDNSSRFAITHITFDPERDTPDRLSQYLDYINPSYTGLTGDIESIRKIAQQLNTVFIYEKPDEYGNYFITHSDSIAVLNPKGEYIGLFKGPYDKEKMLQALKLLVN